MILIRKSEQNPLSKQIRFCLPDISLIAIYFIVVQILRAVSLVTGCFLMAVGGAIGDFNAYSNAMKEKYNLMQSHGKSKGSFTPSDYATVFVTLTGGAFDLQRLRPSTLRRP